MVPDLVGEGCDVDGMDRFLSECLVLVLHHHCKAHQTSLHSFQAEGLEELHIQGRLAHSLADLDIVEIVLGEVQIHNLADAGFHRMQESKTVVGRCRMEAVVGLAAHHRSDSGRRMIGVDHRFENKGMMEVAMVGCIKYGLYHWVGMRLEGQIQDNHLAGYCERSIQNYLPATVRPVSQCEFWKMSGSHIPNHLLNDDHQTFHSNSPSNQLPDSAVCSAIRGSFAVDNPASSHHQAVDLPMHPQYQSHCPLHWYYYDDLNPRTD